MSFRWITEPTQEERTALADYKDDMWYRLNSGLRRRTLDEDLTILDRLLDSVTSKGISTIPITLYRATSAEFVPTVAEEEFGGLAYVSTSVRAENITQFYDLHRPAKLIIQCQTETPMAAFACDDGMGEEQERLLRKETRFRVDDARRVDAEADLLTEICTADRRWAMRQVALLVLRVSIV